MDTSTLLAAVGGFVVVKTATIAVLVARRERRHRDRLVTAVAAARRVDPSGWRLQWAEPGVLLVSNADHGESVHDVGMEATLVAGSGVSASAEHTARFIGTGASVELRFADLAPWLTEVASAGWTSEAYSSPAAREQLACTLTYTIRWVTDDGEHRYESRTAQPVLPVPDLALGPA